MTPGLIDIGINLSSKKFKNHRHIIQNAKDQGVTGLILTGTNYNNSVRSIELCRSHQDLILMRCTVGVHPHDSKTWTKGHFDSLAKLIEDNRDLVVAVGETGLDYNQQRMFSTIDEQHFAFRQQIRLALQLNMPLFLHDRESFSDFKKILEEEDRENKLKKVVHCFTDGYDELKQYLDMGCFIGITGWICDDRRNAALVNGLTRLSAESKYSDMLCQRLMIETDAPFLSPVKDVRLNEPKYIVHVLSKLAVHVNKPEHVLKEHCYKNTCSVFNLPYDPILQSKEESNVQPENPIPELSAHLRVSITDDKLLSHPLMTDPQITHYIETHPLMNHAFAPRKVFSYRDALLNKK